MINVANILSRKDRRLISVTPDTPVLDALRIMADENVGSVLVMENNTYKGLLTERDYARKVILKGKSSADTPVSEIMSTDLPRISPEDSIEHCMELMSSRNIRYLPVFRNNELVGIISINDVIKAIITHQEQTIQQLTSYIHS
ncbi:CBS domain-containing protein [Thermoflavifilum thermophilum]|uniref:CBS domain-containing protein n=1 Tax=Thermoflavifilum thermophilum TaxID=1393122 RepID=A0A1I7NDZ6_9BACT|nr:CBS domain-containing protein [Thermoflavifilum thermophilum]SFV32766.1 CBS domain-containing protein [Thermoflavifilum thermophilum]